MICKLIPSTGTVARPSRECHAYGIRPPFGEMFRGLKGNESIVSVVGFDPDSADAVVNEVEFFGGSFREIDDPVFF